MTHDAPLANQVAVYKRVRDTIAAEFGLDADDDAVLDSAEGETDLADTLTRILRASRLAAAQAKGIADLQKQMAERKGRLEAKAERLKTIALHAMVDAGLPKLAAPDFTVTRGRAQAPLIVPCDEAVPDDMCRIKTTREPDKPKIAAALKEAHATGRAFSYAYFGNAAETLTIRSK